MKSTPIYIKSLAISNIRTFGEDVELHLEKPDGTLPQWTLILGDNGVGKSTLLQCIAWMKPNLPDKESVGPKIEKGEIEMNITNEENETLVSLVRLSGNPNKKANIKAVFVANKKLKRKNITNAQGVCETVLNLGTENRELSDFSSDFNVAAEDEHFFYEQEIIIYAYSASRRLGKLNTNNSDLDDTIPNFLVEETELYDADEILHTINYAMHGSKQREKKKYANYMESVKQLLVNILPDCERDNVNDIHVEVPRLVGKRLKKEEVSITTKHGSKIPFSSFSLGYKTVIAWTVDLSWRLFIEYSKSSKPLHEPAIVLIDEIDLHLHPLWQREIMDNLSKHFPNVQFIATAHSPLMVQAALEANYEVLKYHEDGVIIESNPEGIDGWRVDQILTSEFFGLKSARGLKYDALLDRREELIKIENLNPSQEKELKNINKQLDELPTGENPEEIENRKFISDLVSKIKKNKTKIEL